MFYKEIPALQLLGTPYQIHKDVPLAVDTDVQLVCKYLRAYKAKLAGNRMLSIDRLYRENGPRVKFSEEKDLEDEECHELLLEFMPQHIASTKITQRLFIK